MHLRSRGKRFDPWRSSVPNDDPEQPLLCAHDGSVSKCEALPIVKSACPRALTFWQRARSVHGAHTRKSLLSSARHALCSGGRTEGAHMRRVAIESVARSGAAHANTERWRPLTLSEAHALW